MTETDFATLRKTMVDCQIRTFDVTDQLLIERLLAVPREIFVDAAQVPLAYSDQLLKISVAEHRALLRPLILARALQAAVVQKTDRVLDVAAGTGYTSALLAGLAGSVVALESDPALTERQKGNFAALGLDITTVTGPLDSAAADLGPYDLIFVNGAVQIIPDTLVRQLNEGGRLIAIQQSPADPTGRAAKLVRFEKVAGKLSVSEIASAGAAPILAPFAKEPEFVF
jgi:protein-L-isoaspartate(D-aspartate) O-methyltransferase